MGRMTYYDKSTKWGVLISYFVIGCIFNAAVLFSAGLSKYSNTDKNSLKWVGAINGCISSFLLIVFGFSFYFIATGEFLKGILMLVLSSVFIALELMYIIKKVKALKKEHKKELERKETMHLLDIIRANKKSN